MIRENQQKIISALEQNYLEFEKNQYNWVLTGHSEGVVVLDKENKKVVHEAVMPPGVEVNDQIRRIEMSAGKMVAQEFLCYSPEDIKRLEIQPMSVELAANRIGRIEERLALISVGRAVNFKFSS